MKVKVILVDDHAVVRDGLRAIIEKKAKDIEIVGEAGNANEALKLAKNCAVDIFIVDIALPLMNGIELTFRLRKMYPDSKVLILSMHDKNVLIQKALKAGASGYIVKESAVEDIVKAINDVFHGKIFLSSKITSSFPAEFQKTDKVIKKEERPVTLTKREREILQLIAEGFKNGEIARKLNRSENTIHVHRTRLMQKLNLHREADLVRYALKEDISFI